MRGCTKEVVDSTIRGNKMFKFGKRSQKNLESCHPDIQRLFNEVIKHVDCSVICGHRTEEDQNKAHHSGNSSKEWPESTHNSYPSTAADVIPYPFKPSDWKDTRKLYMFVGVVRGVAAMMGIRIRQGSDWDGDMEVKDQNFHDLPHVELIE